MSAHLDKMTSARIEAALRHAEKQVAAAMAKGLSWQEAYNRGCVDIKGRLLALAEQDRREREALRQWGPANWRDPKGPNTIINHDRANIIGDALEDLCSTDYEVIAAFLSIPSLATDQRLSKMMRSDDDAYTLAKRAINTARINYRNRRQRERDHGTHYGAGTGFVPDNTANTEREALLERVGDTLSDTLTDLERSLLKLRLEGYSDREIEKGTAARGYKVDRREVAKIWSGIEEKLQAKLQAAGVDPESSWRDQLPHHERFNPGGVQREKHDSDDGATMDFERAKWWSPASPEQTALWGRNRTLDRDARQRRPATEAELQECRDAMAAVDARVGSNDVSSADVRVIPGALSKHYRDVEKIERGIKPRGRHASAERGESGWGSVGVADPGYTTPENDVSPCMHADPCPGSTSTRGANSLYFRWLHQETNVTTKPAETPARPCATARTRIHRRAAHRPAFASSRVHARRRMSLSGVRDSSMPWLFVAGPSSWPPAKAPRAGP
jgi:hypothetical protein